VQCLPGLPFISKSYQILKVNKFDQVYQNLPSLPSFLFYQNILSIKQRTEQLLQFSVQYEYKFDIDDLRKLVKFGKLGEYDRRVIWLSLV